MAELQRICKKCGAEKPIGQFRKYYNCRSWQCNACFYAKYGNKQNSVRRSEAGRERRRLAEQAKPRSQRKKLSARLAAERYVGRYPEKDMARRAVLAAKNSGTLINPGICEKCGQSKKRRDGRSAIQAHHDDYSKPLEVRWLCALCHRREHMTLAYDLTASQSPEQRGPQSK